MPPAYRIAEIETSPGAGPAFDYGFRTATVRPGFFEAFDRPLVSGRAFQESDRGPAARTVIVNEAFVRGFRFRGGSGSPIGARLQYSERSAASSTQPWFEIVGIVRDLGVDPDDEGNEWPYVFHAGSPATMSPVVIGVRVSGSPAPLVARLRVIAADVDAGLTIQDVWRLDQWIRRCDRQRWTIIAAQAGVTALVLFLWHWASSRCSPSACRAARARSGCAQRLVPTRARCSRRFCRAPRCSWGAGSRSAVPCC